MSIPGLPPDIEAYILNPGDVLINRMFSHVEPESLLAKLTWNRETLVSAKGSNPVRAWAMMDFAVTAAHMVDWIFHSATPQQRNAWRKSDGNPVSDEREFTTEVCNRWPELHACVVIANAFKHHSPRSHKGVHVYTWQVAMLDGSELDTDRSFEGDWECRIYCDGHVWRDEDFADAVVAQWHRAVEDLGLFKYRDARSINKTLHDGKG